MEFSRFTSENLSCKRLRADRAQKCFLSSAASVGFIFSGSPIDSKLWCTVDHKRASEGCWH